jgi:hypothetical protein
MSFKYHAEFLNILNSIIFFYGCATVISECQYDLLLHICLDASFIVCSLVYYFIIKHKKIDKTASNKIFVLAFFGIIFSKAVNALTGSINKDDNIEDFVEVGFMCKYYCFYNLFSFESSVSLFL